MLLKLPLGCLLFTNVVYYNQWQCRCFSNKIVALHRIFFALIDQISSDYYMQSCSSVSLGSDSLILGFHPKCLTQKGLSLGIRAQAVSVSCLLYRVSATYRKASPDPLMQNELQRSDRGPAEGSLIGRWAFNFKMEVSMKILPLEIPFFCMVSCSASLCFCWVALVYVEGEITFGFLGVLLRQGLRPQPGQAASWQKHWTSPASVSHTS